MTARPLRRSAVLLVAAGAVASGAGPALAHPGLRPAEVVAGEPTELELVVEHDCDPRNGEPSPTTSVAIQVPPELAVVEPLPLEGWRTSAEVDDAGRTTVVEWAVAEGERPGTPPVLPLRVVADTAQETAELQLVVLQECSAGDYLWGGADEGQPPVRLTVSPGTYTPPSPTPDPTPEPAPSDAASVSPQPEDGSAGPSTGAAGTVASDGRQPDDVPVVPLAVTGLAVAAVAAVVVRTRRGGRP